MHISNISRWGAHRSPRRWLTNSKDRHAEIYIFVVFQQQKSSAATYITTISRVQYPLVFQQQILGQSMIQEKWMVQHQKTGLEVDKWFFCFHVCLILCSLCSLLNRKALSWPDIVVAYHSCCFFKVASWFLVHVQVLFAIFGSEIGVDSPMFGFPLWDG